MQEQTPPAYLRPILFEIFRSIWPPPREVDVIRASCPFPVAFSDSQMRLLATSNRGYLEYRPDRAVLRITVAQWRLPLPVDVIPGWRGRSDQTNVGGA